MIKKSSKVDNKKINIPDYKRTEISLVSSFPLGYRHREDITNLPPGVLVVGSQNILTNVSERIQIRQGYVMDGPQASSITTQGNSFDWQTRGNDARNMRSGGLTMAGNDGKLQYRYVDALGTVTWRDLVTGESSVSYNFCTFWDTVNLNRLALFVNGKSQIQAWNGAVTTLLSSTANTLTKSGASWAAAGFNAGGDKSVVINGNTYTYTGGEGTATLTGVSPSPAAEPVGSVVHQSVVTTANSAMTDLPATFANGLIACLNNQVYVGSLTSSVLYLSKTNSYIDYSFASPRIPSDGGTATLDANLVALVAQENLMYVSCGRDFWYNTQFQLSADNESESFTVLRLKTNPSQGAISQASVSQMKNKVIFISNEPTMDELGRVEQILGTPQTTNISDPIKLDFDQYDFTDCATFYHRYFNYVSVPREGVVRMYNLSTQGWEAPQQLPVHRFYVVDGELYGHSYSTLESYKLFTGYSDRATATAPGTPIDAKAIFSYQNFGSRFSKKSVSKFYIEGYISANTILNSTITYEIDGCATMQSFVVDGSDKQIVCISREGNSLGKNSFGKQGLGTQTNNSVDGLPPKFRVFKTLTMQNFFECQFSFEILGVDQRFEILAWGLNATDSTDIATNITQ